MKGDRPRLLLNKVGSRLLIIGYYMPVVACIYGYVILNGVKYYVKHMTKS